MDEPERLLTSGELAREIGVSYRTMQRWQARGYLTPAVRTAGGHRRWSLTAVQQKMQETCFGDLPAADIAVLKAWERQALASWSDPEAEAAEAAKRCRRNCTRL